MSKFTKGEAAPLINYSILLKTYDFIVCQENVLKTLVLIKMQNNVCKILKIGVWPPYMPHSGLVHYFIGTFNNSNHIHVIIYI